MDRIPHDVLVHHILEVLHPDDYLNCLFISLFHPVDQKQYKRKHEELFSFTSPQEIRKITLNVRKRQKELEKLRNQIQITKLNLKFQTGNSLKLRLFLIFNEI